MTQIYAIYEAHKQIVVLAEALAEREILADPTMVCLYAKCEHLIRSATFKSAVYTGRLSKGMCDALSSLCKLVDSQELNLLEEPTFLDKTQTVDAREASSHPRYAGVDSADAFSKHLRERFGLTRNVKIKAITSPPLLLDSNLASFEVDDARQSTLIDEPMNLFLAVVSDVIWESSGVQLGLNKVRFQLSLESSPDLLIENRLGDVKLRDARLTVEGRQKLPRWTLKARDGQCLKGEYTTSEAPLCTIENGRPGDSFKATLSANFLEPGVLVVTTPAPVQNATREIIKRLMEKSIGADGETGGWKTLGVQKIQLAKL
jgi:hypothetical protein